MSLRLSRLIRDTEGIILPLTAVGDDTEVDLVEFDFDVPARSAIGAAYRSAVILITEPVSSPGGLEEVIATHQDAAALVLAPGAHEHLGAGVEGGSAERDSNERGSTTPVLLERSAHVTWSEVLVHLRQLLEGASSARAWPDVDDLSALAAVIAESTEASITIEDPSSRVLAHANLSDDLDDIRKETILTGAIPDWRIAELEESGFLDTVRRSTDVVERPAEGTTPARSVIALRSEGELIGTIWAAYPDTIAPSSLREVLRDASRAAVPVMLRTLRRSPFEKRIRREALGSILAGSPDLGPAATLLALPFSGHYVTLAFAEVPPEGESVLLFHLRAAFADAVLAHIDIVGRVPIQDQSEDSAQPGEGRSHLAALLQMSEPMTTAEVRSHVVSALHRVLSPARSLRFGVGARVDRLDHVHRSWSEAVYVVDALQTKSAEFQFGVHDTQPKFSESSRSSRSGSTIVGATTEDVAAELVSLEAADALRKADFRITAPARVLAHHDREHQGQLLETLRVYFATVGNSAEASRRLHVHTNSLRHRLSRIQEIAGLSPTKRAERLWLELAVLVYDREQECGC